MIQKTNNAPKPCNCVYKDTCKSDLYCSKCNSLQKVLFPSEYTEWGVFNCFCKKCNDEYRENEAQEHWNEILCLVGTKQIKCIKCGQILNHENIRRDYLGDYVTPFKCPACEYEFSLSYPDPTSYDDSYY